jgi:hypothetical protein
MLVLHLVLVTLYKWSTLSIEQDKRIGHTKYNIYCSCFTNVSILGRIPYSDNRSSSTFNL